MRKIYKYIGLVVGLIVLVIIVLCATRREELVISNIQKHYSLLYEDKLELETTVYSSHKNSKYFDSDNIESIKIVSNEETQKLELTNIKEQENCVLLGDKEFYPVVLSLKFSFVPENKCVLNNANLEILYKTNEKLNIKLGNICFLKTIPNNDFAIKSVSSIVNDFGKVDSLAAVIIDLENISEYDLEIINIEPISNTIKINYDYIKIDESMDYSNDILISEVVGETFNSYRSSITSNFELIANQNFRKEIILPLTYTQKELVDSLGFVITYKIEEEVKQQIINPYRLFNTNNVEFVYYEYGITGN